MNLSAKGDFVALGFFFNSLKQSEEPPDFEKAFGNRGSSSPREMPLS